MTTFTADSTSVSVLLVTDVRFDHDAGALVQPLPFAGDVHVTVLPGAPKTGELTILCADSAAAAALIQLLRSGKSITIQDEAHPWIEMSFVPNGTIRAQLERITRRRHLVTVPFQEITT